MSITTLSELSGALHALHQSARESWEDGGPGGDLDECLIEDVKVKLLYEGSNRRTDYRTVLVEGFHFAREAETIPWSVFKEISVSYTCFTALSLKSLNALLAEFPPGIYDVIEEWYPPEDREPFYNAYCGSLEQVVALWKVWSPKYLKDWL